MPEEVVSKNKTPVLKEEAIANLLEALKKHKVNMVEYDKVPEAMKARGMTGIPKHTNKSIKKAGNVLAHIGGPSGSGKTYTLEQLKLKYPHLNIKDLDTFDNQGEKDLGYSGIRKNDYTPEMLKTLAMKRQEIMDNYISKNNNIVFGGHHTEAEHVLNIPTNNKFLLDRGPLRSVIQAYIRSHTTDPKAHRRHISDLPDDYQSAKKDIRDLKKENYMPQSHSDILNNPIFKQSNIMNKEAMLGEFYKKAGNVLAHIGGASGSGKTHLQRGFFKRAEQCNVDKLAALRLLSKSASLIADIPTPDPATTALAASPAPNGVVPAPTPPAFFPTLPPDKQAFKDLTIPRALIGAGIGGLSGGALGFISGHDDDEEDDNSTRNAILGGLAGAGMGGLVGGGFGADKYLKQQALIGIDDTIARRDKLIASGGNPAAYNKHIQQFKDVSLWNAIMHPHKLNKVMPPFSKSTKVEK